MPLPERLGRINRRVTNPITRRFAGRAPYFAIVIHRGRKSGAVYRTPVNAFRTGDDFLFALTYGAGTDWVKNVFAQNGCEVIWRGRTYALADPRFVPQSEALPALPWLVRRVLRLIDVTEFLRLSLAGTASPATLIPAAPGPLQQEAQPDEEAHPDDGDR